MEKGREVYPIVRYPTFIPERIEERRKKEERKKKLAKELARLQKPLIRPVKKKGRGARVDVRSGIKTLIDLT